MVRKLVLAAVLVVSSLAVSSGADAGSEFGGTRWCSPWQRVTVEVLAYGNVNIIIGGNVYPRGYAGAPLQWYRVRGGSSIATWGAFYPESASAGCS